MRQPPSWLAGWSLPDLHVYVSGDVYVQAWSERWVSVNSVQAFAIMEEDLGRPLEQVFSSISERPIAAASLGQVSVHNL